MTKEPFSQSEALVRRGPRRWLCYASAAAVWGGFLLLCSPSAEPKAARPPTPAKSAAEAELPFDVSADTLNYDRGAQEVEAVGHVVIKHGTDELRADHVRFNQGAQQAVATGNVTLKRTDQLWSGHRIEYNFKSGIGRADHIAMDAKPFRLLASDKAEKKSDGTYVLKNGSVSTCTNDLEHSHYHVSAREMAVVPGKSVEAREGTWYFGHVPVMYLPSWHRSLDSDIGYRVRPGYDSRMGAFLLNGFRYRINDIVKGTTHVDLRSRRGVGLGQDFDWKERPGWLQGQGDLSLYYTYDQDPTDSQDLPTDGIDNNRYRIRLRDDYWLGSSDQVLLQANYVSDRDLLEDFFEREFRGGAVPDNFVTYSHFGEGYSTGVRVRGRLNDFYTSVNRMPEVYLDVLRQEIAGSSIYYESQSSAGFLQKQFADDVTNSLDYSAFRLDTRHMLFRPAKFGGFLNVIPRAGARGTYYSKTREQETSTEVVSFVRTNLVADASGVARPVVTSGIETNTLMRDIERGADFRTLAELGLETSFKSFRTWDGADVQYRHIVEPYADYTLIPEPSMTPDQLYQFDDVDSVTKQNFVKLGVRNRLQKKEDAGPWTLADVDVYTICQFERPEDENLFERLYTVTELHPSTVFSLRLDGTWNLADSNLERFNTQLAYTGSDLAKLSLQHLYRDGQSSLAIADVTLLPKRAWSYNLYTRYEFESSRLEEQGGYIQRNLDCMSIRCGANFMPGYTRTDGSQRDDEYRVIFAFWLTAFPDSELGTQTQHMK